MAKVAGTRFDEAEVEEAVQTFQAVADPTRLKILKLLSQHEALCVCELQRAFDLGQATVSHHLRILREAGLVRSFRRSNWAYYALRRDAVKTLIGDLMAAV